MVARADGLTLEEGRVMDALVNAVEEFKKLPVQHSSDLADVINSVHRVQDILATRVARRAFPAGWPPTDKVITKETINELLQKSWTRLGVQAWWRRSRAELGYLNPNEAWHEGHEEEVWELVQKDREANYA